MLQNGNNVNKTNTATIVPGDKTVAGTIIPGSVDVGVHADGVGDSYNITETSNFTILGFKGTAKYTAFTVTSKTPGFSGGGSGTRYVLSEADAAVAHAAALAALTAKITADAKSNLPQGMVLLPGSYTITETSNPNQIYQSDTNQVPVEVDGTFVGIIFNTSELAQKIASLNVTDYDGSPVTIPELGTFTVAISPSTPLTETSTALSITLSLVVELLYGILILQKYLLHSQDQRRAILERSWQVFRMSQHQK